MTNIPFHEHTFVIPTATTEEIAAGIISDKAITPDQLLPVLESIGAGDMLAATYDPNGVAGDAFDMDNMVESATNLILTASERALIASAVQAGDALVPADIGTTVQAWDAQLDSLSSASVNGVSLVTAADYAAMRALLDLEAGTDFYSKSAADAAFQPLDSDLTSIAALTTTAAGRSVLTITDPNVDQIMAWDDSAGAVVPIALAAIASEGAPASGDYLLAYLADGSLAKIDWADLPSGGGGGSGDMLAATYDPTNKAADAFDMTNMAEGTTNKIFTATERTKLSGIASGADVTSATNVASVIHAATGKSAPVDADELGLIDSAASNVLKKVTWANVKATLKTYLDTLYQPLTTILTAIGALATTGLIARTGAGTVAVRTLTAPAAGVTFTNGDGVSGNPTLALANDLAALEALSSTGIAARTAADTWAQRTIAGTANQIAVTNGDGVSGNPTIAAVVASQAEAEAGTDTTKLMTAERVAQAIAAQAPAYTAPSTSSLPVGAYALLFNNSGGSVSSNATTAGSGLKTTLGTSGNALVSGATQTGTWKNISGASVGAATYGIFVRTV